MNPKLQKVITEIEKTKQKILQSQSVLRDLEHQKTGLENAEIVAAVRGTGFTQEELEAILRTRHKAEEFSATNMPSAYTPRHQEDTANEE